MEENVLRFDPSVFVVGHDYQIIFLTTTMGIGWIEIDGNIFRNITYLFKDEEIS